MLFRSIIQKVIDKYNKTDHIVIAGDLNARVGKSPIPNVCGTYGEETINENGKVLRNFATFNELKLTNTFFKKKDIHKYTWAARGSRSLIDYVIVNDKLKNLVKDTTVNRGAELYTDHYLVTTDLYILAKWKNNTLSKRNNNKEKDKKEIFKTYLLQDSSIRDMFQNRMTQYLIEVKTEDNIEKEYRNIKNIILKTSREVLGTRRNVKKKKGLNYWNEEIERAIKEKKIAYMRYLQDRSQENERNYKLKRNIAKAKVKESNQESWNKFLATIEHDIYGRQNIAWKVMRHLKSTDRDVAKLTCIPKEEWTKYYSELLHDEDIEDVLEDEIEEKTVDMITLDEMQEEIRKMKNRKAPGTDNIPIEIFKYGGLILQFRLLHILNMCWRSKQIPKEWETAKVISIFKKGQRNECRNYRGISLLNVMYKIYARIITSRLKVITETHISEEQNGFRKGRACIDNVFTIKQIIEKRREFNLETHMAFIDLQKAFDKVNRLELWNILNNKGYPSHIIKVIRSLYKDTKMVIEIDGEITEELKTNQGLKQGCSLSPILFNIYLDEILKEWKQKVHKGINLGRSRTLNVLMFADDIVLIFDTEDRLQKAVYELNKICKEYNMIISENKTKIMAFQGRNPVRSKIIIEDSILEQVSHFQYLGCDITYKHDQDVDKKIQKFQAVCGTIKRTFKNKVRQETQLRYYSVMALPVICYGSETWTVKEKDKSRIQAAEMRFLRSVKGCTREDHIRNVEIRKELQVIPLLEQIENYREKWTNHLSRMTEERIPKQALQYRPRGRREIGRPRKRWTQQL